MPVDSLQSFSLRSGFESYSLRHAVSPRRPIPVHDTLESIAPSTNQILERPRKNSQKLQYALAIIGAAGGYLLASLRQMEPLAKAVLTLTGGFIFYSIGSIPQIIHKFKNKHERFWASLELSSWTTAFIQKILATLVYLPKITSQASKIAALTRVNFFLSFVSFALSAIASTRSWTALKDIKNLHALDLITTEHLKKFILNHSDIKWVLENQCTQHIENLNKLIEKDPKKALNWIKKTSKASLVFSSLYTISQITAAIAVVAGACFGGISGVPFFAVSTLLYGLTLVSEWITNKVWTHQMTKELPRS